MKEHIGKNEKVQNENSKLLKNHMRKVRKLGVLTGLGAVLLISTVYAWFSTTRDVSVTNLKGTIEVADSIEISLDAKNWSHGIDLDNVDLINDAYSENTNKSPKELVPVSTSGEALIGTDESGTKVTYLPMYGGTYTPSKGLSDITLCDETITNVNQNDYPGYFAFDIFLRNYSSDNAADTLQLNYNSFASVLRNSITKEIKTGNIVIGSKKYIGDDTSGLQNTIRVGFVLFNNTAEATATQSEVISKTVNDENLAVKNISIWEPNSGSHVDYIVTNNNKVKNYTSGQNFTSTTKFFTKTLNRFAVGQEIKDVYDWADTNTYLSKPITNQTTKKSSTDYRIAEKIVDLKQVDGTNSFQIEPNKISRIRIYVWLEGQDVDCINYASFGGGIELCIGLIKDADPTKVVDTPMLVSLSATKSTNNTYMGYTAGTIIEIKTTYSQDVYGTSSGDVIEAATAPVLKVKFGTGSAKTATFKSSAGSEIVYTYTVADEDTGVFSIDSITGVVYNLSGDSAEVYDIGLPDEEDVTIPVTGVSLNKTSTSIIKGSTEALIATVEPSNATNQKVTWTSSNTDVATVDSAGIVTAVADSGTSTITVTTEDGSFTASCVVEGITCFAKGTKITMEGGQTKNIEDIKEGESVLTFNHELGIYEAQEVYYIFSGKNAVSSVTLNFDNGKSVTIVGEHDLFEKENLKYVTLSEGNAQSFVGKHFYSVEDGKYVKLLSVTKNIESVDYYSIYTKNNVNCIANGMLSIPKDTEHALNIYEFNEDLTIDHEQLAKDIQTYGIFEYDASLGYTMEEYEYMKICYINIALGKGIASWEEMEEASSVYLGDK